MNTPWRGYVRAFVMINPFAGDLFLRAVTCEENIGEWWLFFFGLCCAYAGAMEQVLYAPPPSFVFSADGSGFVTFLKD